MMDDIETNLHNEITNWYSGTTPKIDLFQFLCMASRTTIIEDVDLGVIFFGLEIPNDAYTTLCQNLIIAK